MSKLGYRAPSLAIRKAPPTTRHHHHLSLTWDSLLKVRLHLIHFHHHPSKSHHPLPFGYLEIPGAGPACLVTTFQGFSLSFSLCVSLQSSPVWSGLVWSGLHFCCTASHQSRDRRAPKGPACPGFLNVSQPATARLALPPFAAVAVVLGCVPGYLASKSPTHSLLIYQTRGLSFDGSFHDVHLGTHRVLQQHFLSSLNHTLVKRPLHHTHTLSLTDLHTCCFGWTFLESLASTVLFRLQVISTTRQSKQQPATGSPQLERRHLAASV